MSSFTKYVIKSTPNWIEVYLVNGAFFWLNILIWICAEIVDFWLFYVFSACFSGLWAVFHYSLGLHRRVELKLLYRKWKNNE